MPTIEETFRIAFEHQRAGRLAEAEKAYLRILEVLPDRSEALHNLGFAQQMQGKLVEAIGTYRSLLARTPGGAATHARLGEVMYWLGRLGSAIDHYEVAVALSPQDQGLRNALDQIVHIRDQRQTLMKFMDAGNRLDLRDVTFMIPCRIESADRRRNLRILVSYLLKHLNTNILICEDNPAGSDVPGIMEELGVGRERYDYIHLSGNDSPFTHKAKQINLMAEAARTPILVVQDTDVLVEATQYVFAQSAVRYGAMLARPSNGLFFDVGADFVPVIGQHLSLGMVDLLDPRNPLLYKNSYGGAVFFSREAFTRLGGFNENFVSWGWEDFEMAARIEKLGEPMERAWGPLLHLSHERATNSVKANAWYANNTAEYDRVVSMSKEQILAEIAAGSFRRPLIDARSVPEPAA